MSMRDFGAEKIVRKGRDTVIVANDFSPCALYLNFPRRFPFQSDDRKYVCLIGPDNPIGLHVVRQIGPDGIIVAWKSPQFNNTIESFEVR